MKNVFRILCGLLIISFTTVACNKEVETNTPDVVKHSVKVTADFSPETRTEMLSSGNETKWSDDDCDNMHFFENGIAPAEEDLDVSLNSDKTVLTIAAEFANTSASKYVYTSILASNLDENKKAILDNEQFLFDGTFDPLADILVAKPEEFDANQNLVDFSMQYKRVVAINKMKIKGLVANDKIETVTISSNKPILGSYSMTDDAWTNSGYELTLSAYDDIVVSAKGDVSLYFITAPVEDTKLSIYVETTNHKYEKDFTKTISFAANTVTSFATTVADCEIEEHVGTNNYVRVESTADLTTGQYLLVSEYHGKVFKEISTTSTKYGIENDVVISNHSITPANVEASGAQVLELADASTTTGAYVFKFDNKYLTWTSGNSLNTASSDTENSNWTISISSGNATIANVADETRIILRNCGSPRFACYAGQTPKDDDSGYDFVQLYKLDVNSSGRTPLAKPVIVVERNATLDGLIVTWNDVNKAANYTVTCTGQTSQTVAQGVQRAEFTDLEPGTYAVTVTANPANSDRNTATTSDEASLEILDYQLVAPRVTFSNTAESIVATWNKADYDAGKATGYSYKILDGETVVVDEKTVTTGGFEESGLTQNHNYIVQFKINGKAPYLGTEYTSLETKTLKPAMTTIAEVKAELADDATSYEVTLTNAIITGKWESGAYIQDKTAGIYIYGASVIADLTVGDSYSGTVSGAMKIYNGQPELTSFNLGDDVQITHNVALPLEDVTIAELNSNMSNYDGKRVRIIKAKTNAVLNVTTGSQAIIAQGSNTLTLMHRTTLDAAVAADTYIDVIGFPMHYKTSSQDKNEIIVTDPEAINASSITWQLKSIGIATQPTKRTYTAGEYFDPAGLVISTVVEDASDATIFKNGDNVPYAGNENDFSFNPGLNDALTVENTSVTISYGGKSTSQAITVRSSGGGDTHDDIVFNLDLSEANTYPNDFPTTAGTTTGSYEFDGYVFGFKANTAFYFSTNTSTNTSYLIIGKSGKTEATTSYIELPAPEGYKLTEVSISTSATTSTNLKAYVGSSYSSKVTDDWQFVQNGTSDWTLSGVTSNVVYRIYLVGTGSNTYNGQITAVHAKFVYDN